MKRCLIALNGFKECASGVELSTLLRQFLREKNNDDKIEFIVKPISDGGDGFLEVVEYQFDIKIIKLKAMLPFDEKRTEFLIGYSEKEKTVFIESAKIIGLNIVPPQKRNPLKLSSAGFGEILKTLNALKNKGDVEIEKVIAGTGGTATSDLGIGALSSLGLKLFDSEGFELKAVPEYFMSVKNIEFGNLEKISFELEFVLDVENPLFGKNGANQTFAKQKGADAKDISMLEKGFENILSLLPENILEGKRLSGAGGGLAAGFEIFYNVKYKSARDFILKDLSLSGENSNFDLVISGEGKLDNQTGMQKGVQVIVDEFQSKIPVLLIAGSVENYSASQNVKIIELRKYFSSIDESIKNYKIGLKKAADEIIAQYLTD